MISEILAQSRDIFKNEPLLLEFELENSEQILVLGDIHGNLQTLMKLIDLINKENPKFIISLGDIVDRGPKQLECLILMLSLKILNPNKFFILKGNHETFEMNQAYGFFHYFLGRFKNPNKFNEILAVYNVLPICAIVNNSILCLHGGIPEDIEILSKLKGLKTSDIDQSLMNSIGDGIFQIIWNDPKESLRNFSESFRGSGIKFFGEGAFNKFMDANNLKYLIRAHECFPEGYRWFFNKKLLSIFSAANYRGPSSNPASYAVIRKNTVILKTLELS
jgi:serine/threonine-protein phosphatase PP1 catalytic subunit